jgi:CxxC motif-containing protein (DUF1111 family)
VAEGFVVSTPEVVRLLAQGELPKGEALGVARIAGILGAKATSTLIPLCHPLALDGVDIDLETVNHAADYMRLLAVPGRDAVDDEGTFVAAGCDTCHTPSLPTRADWPVPQLAGVDAPIFTDLLLHDMGQEASDGLTDGDADPSEWRTAPLIGLRFLRSYLHDGRADTIEAAIEAHAAAGSEAAWSVDLYRALDDSRRAALIAYVESL